MIEQIHVLYVDDEPDLLLIGKQFLEKYDDLIVTTANSAENAITLLNTHSFDLIISDYQMPYRDGIAFLKYLKSVGNTIPFILFTGKGREDVVIEALNNGADFYLQKGGEPITQFAEMVHIIRQTVSRRRSDIRLKETEKRMSQIIDFLPDATFAIDNDGIVIAWNQAMEEMTGISKKTMLGQGDHAYSIPFYGNRRKELLDLLDLNDVDLASSYGNIQRKGHTISAETFTPALFHGKGAYVWAIGRPLFDVNGNRAGAIESIRDITERTEIKEELYRKNKDLEDANEIISHSKAEIEERESQLRLISDNLPNGMVYQILINPDGTRRFTYLSAGVERLHGLKTEDVLHDASLVYAQIIDEDKSQFIERENFAIQHLSSFTAEVRVRNPDGTIRWALFRSIPHPLPNGATIWDGIETDISDLKCTEVELTCSNRLLETIIQQAPFAVHVLSGNLTHIQVLIENDESKRIMDERAEGIRDIYSQNPEEMVSRFFSIDGTKEIPVKDTPSLRAFRGEHVKNEEYLFRHTDGTEIFVSASAIPVSDESGEINAVVVMLYDISQKTKNELLLKETNEAFIQAQRIGKIGSWMYDTRTGQVSWSDELYRVFGREPDSFELTLETIRGMIHPDDLDQHDQILKKAIETGEYEWEEYRVIYPDNSVHYIKAEGIVERDCQGFIARLIGVCQNITDQKITKDELIRKNEELAATYEEVISSQNELQLNYDQLIRQEEQLTEIKDKFESLYTHMIDGAALHELVLNNEGTPVDYRIIEINPAFEQKLGLFREMVIGRTSREVYGVSDPPYLDIYARVTRSGNAEIFEAYFSPMDKYFNISVYCPYPGSFATIFEDITERKKAEASLIETNEYLESLISIANVPIIVWDSSFQITRINHAFEHLIGRRSDEVIGTPLHLLFPQEQGERSIRLLKSTLDGVRWETTEIDIMHKDGSIRTLLWNSATLYTRDGITLLATIAQGHDITRERRLEQERDSALSQIKQNLAYLAILNDEIRNPLNIILMYSDLIHEQNAHAEIIQQIHHIDQLITQLDKRWIKSEKILDYLQKHHQITFNGPPATPDRIPGDGDESDQLVTGGDTQRSLLIEEMQAQLYTILDSLDALVYVADMDTYELLYMNQRGRNYFGSGIGRKCHQFLNSGSDDPCPFCTNQILREEFGVSGVYHWEYQNPGNGRWYFCRDRIIRWTDGRLVKLEIATDITRQKQMEQTLLQEKMLLSQTERIAHMGSWKISLKTREVTFSEEMYTIFGIKKENFILDMEVIIDSYVYPDDREQVREHIGTMIKGGICQEFEYRIVRPDGSIVWVHNQGEQERDDCGNVISITGFLEDISRRKTVEKRLKDSEQKFHTVFRTNPVPLILVSAVDGVFTDVNDAFLHNSGYSYEDIIGKKAENLNIFVDRTEYQHFSSELQKKHFVQGIEVQCRNKSGEIQICRFSSKLIMIDGKPQILSSVENITGTKEVEIQLHENEMRYRAISEISTDFQFSYIKNKDSRYLLDWLTGSVSGVTGYSVSDLQNRGCWRWLVHPDDQGVFDEYVMSIPPGEVRGCDLRIITKEGDVKWLSVHTTHLFSNREPFSERLYGGCRDITEYKRSEEDLRRSEETYRLTLESTNDGFWEWDFRNGRAIFSDRYYTMLGYTPGEFPASFEAWKNLIHPEDRDRTDALLRQQVQDRVEFPQIEYRIQSKNGDWVWILGKGKAVGWDNEGNITRLMGSNIDITERKRIEESLKESEENYRKLVHNIPDYILVHRNGEILFVNDTAVQVMGYSKEEIIGSNILQYLTPESRERVREMMDKRFSGINLPSYEITLHSRDGIKRVTEVRGVIIQYQGGSASLNVLTDITAEKEALEALHQNEERLLRIIDAVQVGIIIIDAQTHIILEVNKKAQEMIKTTNDFIVGMVCHTFICPAESGRCPITDLNQSVDSSERILLTADGSTIPIIKTVIKTTLGGKEVLIESIVDISERKRIEDALRTSEIHYRQLFEHANDAILIARHRSLLLVNPQMTALTGYSEEELLSMPYTDIIHPDDRTHVTDMHDRRRQCEDVPPRYSFRVIRKDRRIIWVEISSVLIDWKSESAILSFLMDITDRKQAEDALRESNKKLRLLSSLTRHDIFNQLSVIDVYQEMALGSSDPKMMHDHIMHARLAGKRIEEIIGFTRQYEDFGVVSSGWVPLFQTIESAKNEVIFESISVENSIPPDIEIYADPIIRKVFATLMENAVRHGKTTTAIRFSGTSFDTDLIIICEDDGVGVRDEEKKLIFDHGYGSHTGIGLYLAQAILSITGLTIQESGVAGKGARFEIRVPNGKYRYRSGSKNRTEKM